MAYVLYTQNYDRLNLMIIMKSMGIGGLVSDASGHNAKRLQRSY